jgi:hypothetical protein
MKILLDGEHWARLRVFEANGPDVTPEEKSLSAVRALAIRKDKPFRYSRRDFFFAGLSLGTVLTIAEGGM